MAYRQTPEAKAMHSHREADDDGFAYVYGKHKAGRTKRPRNRNAADRAARYDKRATKARETLRMLFKEFA